MGALSCLREGMKQKPTIATVAERAGVGRSTVSRYFNGHYVSKAIKARLSKVVAELGYSRSWTARNLSLGRRGCIGVVVDSSQDLWFTQLLIGIEEELSTGETTLALNSLKVGGRYASTVVSGWIRERRVDGLIIAKSERRERSLLNAAIEARMPTVLVAPDEVVAEVDVVRCDNYSAGLAVADHLCRLGHTCVAFAGGPQHSIDSKHRLRGLRDGLARSQILLEPENVSFCGSYEAESGIVFAHEFLAKPLSATALALGNDALALGFMRVAQQRGIKIPEELSIVGFDNVPEGAFWWPGLTTMAQPIREMGRSACRRLLEVIDSDSPRDARPIQYSMELVVRESTGPAPLRRSGPRSIRLLDNVG
jgi:LacI family transcriptional regulator